MSRPTPPASPASHPPAGWPASTPPPSDAWGGAAHPRHHHRSQSAAVLRHRRRPQRDPRLRHRLPEPATAAPGLRQLPRRHRAEPLAARTRWTTGLGLTWACEHRMVSLWGLDRSSRSAFRQASWTAVEHRDDCGASLIGPLHMRVRSRRPHGPLGGFLLGKLMQIARIKAAASK
jgi:hypothetical protein